MVRRATKCRGLPESEQSFIRGVGTPHRQSAAPTKRRAYFLFISGSVRTAKRRPPPKLLTGGAPLFRDEPLVRRGHAAKAPGRLCAARIKTLAGGFSGPDFTQQKAPPFSGAFINLWMYRIRLIGATVFDTILTLFFIRPGNSVLYFFHALKRRCRQARIGGLKLRQPRAKRHGLRR